MADLPTLRKQVVAAEQQFTSLTASLRHEQDALNQALRQGKPADATTHTTQIANLQQQRTQARAAIIAARQALDALRQSTLAAIPVADPVGGLDPNLPIVFFPVRLETRWQGNDLLIRVYPDDVHISTHEPELTAAEVALGQAYWTQVWRSGPGPQATPAAQQAWSQLADSCGPERAAWVIRALEPRNPAARPQTPIAAGAALPTAPDFPSPPQRESSWTRAPYAAALPDRWIALGYSPTGRAFQAVGSVIPDRLTVGFDPAAEKPTTTSGAGPLVSDEMRWLMDFDVAVAAGMALRVSVASGVVSAGLVRLIVFGVKGSMDGDESAAALTALLDGHHYTRGLSFLPRGTPTNNTDSAPSGYGSRDPGHARSFAAECLAPLFQPGSGLAGDLAARALGVDASVFSHAWKADDADDAAARNMNTALWPATWGYFLDKRMPGLVSDAGITTFRNHFIHYVRGGGALPTLRLRDQPYGLLPITGIDLWQPVAPDDIGERALTVLRGLQDRFSLAASNVPRIGMSSDPDQDLLAALKMSPVSMRYAVRHMLGPLHTTNFFGFAGAPLSFTWWNLQKSAAVIPFAVPGLPADTPQARSLFSNLTQSLDAKPLVTAGTPQDYLKTLAAADLNTLRNNTTLPAGQRPLLYDLARHSTLLSYADAVFRILSRAGLMTPEQRLEPELVNIDPGSATFTVWQWFEATLPNVTGTQMLRDYLSDPAHESNPDVAQLAETRQSLRQLSTETPEKLAELLSQVVDVSSHRLDAWVTSLATRRLDAVRQTRPTGVIIGGYGWVENVNPTGPSTSDGYVLTPSIAHASTAAILASGYMAHRNDSGPNPFAIDLSSQRVRLAYRLIEGIRTGQPVGALLGYELERSLQEQGLTFIVAGLRKIAPLPTTPTTGDIAAESVAANNVVNGGRALEMWNNRDPLFETVVNDGVPHFLEISAVFQQLADDVDALGDVLLTDNIHQIVEGNYNRAAMTLSDVLAGQTIARPDVLSTPRTGITMAHRVLAILDPNQPVIPAWNVDSLQARAGAEPVLNAWAAHFLGDPKRIQCRATYTGSAPARVVQLSELALSPLDAVYVTASSGQGRSSEFEQRLTYYLLRTRPAGVPVDAVVTVDYSRDPQWAPDILSVEEFLAMADALRQLLRKARPLSGSDLAPADQAIAPGLDPLELMHRADVAVKSLRTAQQQLQQALAAAGPFEPVRTALLRLASLGLTNAVPVSAVDGSAYDNRLGAQAAAAVGDIGDRLKKIDSLTSAFTRATETAEVQVQFDISRLRVVFGPDFPVLPRFSSPNTGEISVAFANSDALKRNRRIEVVTWFARLSRVRERLGRLADVLRLGEVFGHNTPAWTVAQLPFAVGECWSALTVGPDSPTAGRLSLVACGPINLAANQPLAGVVFDEWSEVIPSARESAGMAFHYVRPSIRPPQAILLAAAPDLKKPWNLLYLEQILRETLSLVKMRMVDRDAMPELSQYLPAICLPINAAGDTITADVRAK